jgi:hypothetical protein
MGTRKRPETKYETIYPNGESPKAAQTCRRLNSNYRPYSYTTEAGVALCYLIGYLRGSREPRPSRYPKSYYYTDWLGHHPSEQGH